MPSPTPVPDPVASFLAAAPKVELHLHLVGSASPATLARLAERRPESGVWAALDRLGADRIGHGVRAIEDLDLVARLAETGTPLEVCPSSNVCTRVYPNLAEHPIARLREAGVVVTVNTDDPHMFGTDLDEEYRRLAGEFGWGVAELVRAGIDASLLDDAAKRRLAGEVDAVADADTDGAADR